MSLVIKQTRVVEVPVQSISIAATCQQAMLIDADGQCVGSTNAMPAFMPTLLEIDLATGRIKNWTVPSCEQLQDIADTSEIQRMSEGEYHHFMNDRLFRNAVPLEQATTPPQTDDGWVDESHMPYGYFDDERDPALLNSAPTLGSTSAPTQALESAAFTVANTTDCAPTDKQHNPLEVFDEPTDSDTALCPDVSDSFYAAPAESEPAQQKNAWTPDGRVFLRDLSAVSAHHNLDLPSFYMYQRFGLMTGSKGAIDLTPAGTGLLLMLRNAKKNAEADALVAHFGQPEPVVPVILDSNVLTIDAPLTLDMLLDATPATKKPSVDIGVSFSKAIGKWVADVGNDVVGEHQATSTQGKFEAIKNVLKKAGLNGVYEINQRDSIDDVEFYSYDDSRTKDRMSIYISGHKASKDCVASTSKGHRHTAPSRAQALDGLIANVLKVVLPDDAIVDTTDDAMLFAEKWRYSIDMAKAVAIVEPTTTDIEDAPEPNRQPARPRYQNPDDHSQTWTGRGKPPEWLQAKLDAGEQLTDYAISDSAA